MASADRETALPVRIAADADADSGGGMAPYVAFCAAQAVVRVLPRSAAYALGAAGGELLARLHPSRFNGLRANLRHVMTDADAATVERTLRANVRNLARCWIDVMEMPYRPQQIARRLDIVDGFEHFLAASARGHGVVVVSMHLGAWESGLAAWNRFGGELALLAEEVRPRKFFERIIASRESMGVKVIPIDAAAMRNGDAETARRIGAQAMRDVIRHLRAGNTIAIAIDRDITGGGVKLPFFGTPAPIPIGTVDVAIRAGAAVLPVTLTRSGGRYQGWVHPEVKYDVMADRAPEVRRVAANILHLFEGIIRDHPDMWHVLEPIWADDHGER